LFATVKASLQLKIMFGIIECRAMMLL